MSAPPPETFVGGLAETNAYLLHDPEGALLIDAPEGTLDWLKSQDIEVTQFVLTHGHWDHIWDAAAVIDQFQTPVVGHRNDQALFENPDIMQRFGLPVSLPPVQITRWIDEGDELEWGSRSYDILHIPGHCPGSICLVDREKGQVFGGDVLFAGAIGRWDLPGGSRELLLQGIARKLLPLPDDYQLFPGHGPATTLGREKSTNPFCLEAQSFR